MLAFLLTLVPLVVAQAARQSPAGHNPARAVVLPLPPHRTKTTTPSCPPPRHFPIPCKPPRHLPVLPDSVGLVSTGLTPSSTATAQTAVNIQRDGPAMGEDLFHGPPASTLAHGVTKSKPEHPKQTEYMMFSDEPLMGLTTAFTTEMTITVSCELDHSLFRCDMPMNGLTSEVCVTAEGQVLCHVPIATRTSSMAKNVVNSTTIAPLSTACSPGQTHQGNTLTDDAYFFSYSAGTAITTSPPRTPASLPVSASIGNMLSAEHTTKHHSDKTTVRKPIATHKSAASSKGRPCLDQALVGLALVVVFLRLL